MMIEEAPFEPARAAEIVAPALRWFVLVTLSGLERVAKMHLDEAGIETFLPLVETERKRPPRGRTPELPYLVVPRFPGYLFVHLERDDARWAILAQDKEERPRGVIGALRSESGRAIPVPARQIDRWLAMADKDGIVEHWAAPEPEEVIGFEYGAVVRIKKGAYFDPNHERVGVVDRQRGEAVTVIFGTARWSLRWDQIEEVL